LDKDQKAQIKTTQPPYRTKSDYCSCVHGSAVSGCLAVRGGARSSKTKQPSSGSLPMFVASFPSFPIISFFHIISGHLKRARAIYNALQGCGGRGQFMNEECL
jgi:hypothetical protein